jgi:DNA-binding PadR family transcriptional regulator
MEYDRDKVDEMTLALLYLVTTGDKRGARAWKTFDWDTMDRLHAKGVISDPKRATKSVALSEEGQRRSEELFRKYFT